MLRPRSRRRATATDRYPPDQRPSARRTLNRRLSSRRARAARRRAARQRRRTRRGATVRRAQQQLRRYSQASLLAVATTGLLLLVVPGAAQEAEPSGPAEAAEAAEAVGVAARDELLTTFDALWHGFYANLPKILVAIVVVLLAWGITRLLRFGLRRLTKGWRNAGAVVALTSISVWLLAIGVALSVVAGDIRALVGSLGLVGLALSWSLQTPIESFTGWLLNSFRGYYRVGDRISVGEVFGDVYQIDFLTTTVWEIGAPYRNGYVQAEQPTGRLVTFPNNEILAGSVVNLTGDFPYVWDELAIAVANESDLEASRRVILGVAQDLLGDYMRTPAERYARILREANLAHQVPTGPELYISLNESWTDVIVRYLVGARERRRWKSELSLRVMAELNKLENKQKIKAVYPRQQVQFVNADGDPDLPLPSSS